MAPRIGEVMGNFIEEFPDYSEQIITTAQTNLMKFDLTDGHVDTVVESMEKGIDRFVTFNQNIVPRLINKLDVIGQTLIHILLGVVLSIYVLAKKEMLQRQFGNLSNAVLGDSKYLVFLKWLKRANVIFGRFFLGLLLNAAIIGTITTVVLFIFRVPFALLVGFIVGSTNIVPIFGPLIGSIPSAIMIFFVSPAKALVFIVLILIIQQIDANFITPKILGSRIGIAPFWVLVSIIVFGHLFGLLGMIIGVPITALTFEIVREIVNAKIDKKKYKKQIIEA